MKQKIEGEYTQTVELNGQEVEVDFTATATLEYQAAQTSGPPESCYPEESDFDLESIQITGARLVGGQKMPLAVHTMKLLREAIDEDLLAEQMWEEFDQQDDDQSDED